MENCFVNIFWPFCFLPEDTARRKYSVDRRISNVGETATGIVDRGRVDGHPQRIGHVGRVGSSGDADHRVGRSTDNVAGGRHRSVSLHHRDVAAGVQVLTDDRQRRAAGDGTLGRVEIDDLRFLKSTRSTYV